MKTVTPLCALALSVFIWGMPAYAADRPEATVTLKELAAEPADSGIAAIPAAELPRPQHKPAAPATLKLSSIEPAAGDAPIRLTPDRAQTLQLDKDAVSVVVTNPAHANVLLDTPRTLVIMPRTPGTTSFTVLDAKGTPILQKTIIVATSADTNYVRIRRMCGQNDPTCVPAAYYYCPDGCYEVQTVPPVAGDMNLPPATGNGPAASAPNASNMQIDQSPVQVQVGPDGVVP
jgi:hypothetical protein